MVRTLGLLRGLLRGGIAWSVGHLLSVAAVLAGLAGGADGVPAAGTRLYVEAHATSPAALGAPTLLPLVVLVVGGYRAGRATRTGVVGRLRSLVRSVRGDSPVAAGAVAGLHLLGGYALTGTAVAALLGASPAAALVGALAYGPVAVAAGAVGARRS